MKDKKALELESGQTSHLTVNINHAPAHCPQSPPATHCARMVGVGINLPTVVHFCSLEIVYPSCTGCVAASKQGLQSTGISVNALDSRCMKQSVFLKHPICILLLVLYCLSVHGIIRCEVDQNVKHSAVEIK